MGEMRRYRAWLRTILTTGVVMSAVATGALAVGLATGLVPGSIFGFRELIAVAIRGFVAGAVAGGLFAWIIRRAERGQTLSSLSTRRVALWGAVATGSMFVLAALAAPVIVPIGVIAAAGAIGVLGGGVVSASMLRLARRAPRSLEQLDARADLLLQADEEIASDPDAASAAP